MDRQLDYSINIVFLVASIFSLLYLGIEYFNGGTVDDTYIIYRYVENLYSGAGFRWNIGGEKVQGFTSMGWVLVLAASRLFTESEIHTYAPRIGLAFSSVALLLAFLTSRRVLRGRIRFFSFLIPLALTLSPAYVRHSISGMETAMVFFTVSLICFVSTFHKSGIRYDIAMSVTTIISGLARPDLILIPVILHTTIELYKSESIGEFIRLSYVYYFLCLSMGITYLSWKYIYFGDILPLPSYMKSNPKRTFNFVRFIFSWQLKFFAYAAVPILIFIFSSFKLEDKKEFYTGISISVLSFTIYLFSVIPAVNFHYRYQMAVFIPIVMLSIYGLKLILEYLINTSKFHSLIVFSMICTVLVLHNVGRFTEIRNESTGSHNSHSQHVNLAINLKPIDGLSIAGSEAGRLPYFSGATHIDILGLNTKFIAYNRFDSSDFEKKLANYIDKKEPDIYMDYSDRPWADIKNDSVGEKYEETKCYGLNVMILVKSKNYPKIRAICKKSRNMN